MVFALTASLLMGLPSPAGAVAGYGDVGEGNWYTDPVQWSTDNGITDISGFCFAPDAVVSRGETAVWIYNMENQPAAGALHSFTDVTDASQDDAVSWMSNSGITTGTGTLGTTFSPEDTLTRAQAATFLHRLDGEPDAPAHSFVDVVDDWQQGGVSWMADRGITTGTSETMFSPEDTLTRAQLITFLYRYKNKPDVTINPATPDCDPTTDNPPASFKAVSAGGDHSCAIRTDDTVTCWGQNSLGQADAPTGSFKAVSAGRDHSCGIRTDDTITCWGSPAGETTTMGSLTTYRQIVSKLSAQAGAIVAGYVPTTPSPAGDATLLGRLTRRQIVSKLSAQAEPIVAGYVPTTPSSAGAWASAGCSLTMYR